jgi:hypothetical protein
MAYRTKDGKLVRQNKRMLTLYHFTPPRCLPEIIKNGIYPFSDQHGNQIMLPGLAAVWLTSDPYGNRITDAHLAYWRRIGQTKLIAEYEAGRRLLFGYNDSGSARITLELPRAFQGLSNYLQLIKEVYREWPPALAFITDMPNVADWWVVASPAISETFTGIGPRAITEVQPVGEETPDYIEAIEQITRECGGEERAA